MSNSASEQSRPQALAPGSPSCTNCRNRHPGVVVAVGLALDLVALHLVLSSGGQVSAAHLVGYAFASTGNFVLGHFWARPKHGHAAGPAPFARLAVVGIFVLLVRGAVIATCLRTFSLPPGIALLAGCLATSAMYFLNTEVLAFSPTKPRLIEERWAQWTVAILAFSFLMRLAFLGGVELLPQEAYYWNYAQHPALSYLDHPPLTAWGITVGTAIFGNGEFGVRACTFAFSVLSALFLVAFARNLIGRGAALGCAVLYAALPAFFSTGIVVTPDAGVVLGWAASLFFLERAILGARPRAWIGLGVCFGFGLLAKYTIVLLVPATFVFLMVDRPSRRILRTRGPYLACLIATLVFSPVIIWNAQNEWASFAFQSTTRLSSLAGFSLHTLVLAWLALLTPIGLTLAMQVLFRRSFASSLADRQRRHFALAMTVVPLSVFVLYSLNHRTIRLSWTIPIWIAPLPLMGAVLWTRWAKNPRGFVTRVWAWNVVASTFVLGGALYFFALGIPGVAVPHSRQMPTSWSAIAREVDGIVAELESEYGDTPVVIDATSYYIASALAYYGRDTRDGVRNTSGAHLIGGPGLMYESWIDAADWAGAPAVIVALTAEKLSDARLSGHLNSLSPIRVRIIHGDGVPCGRFWYRTARLAELRPLKK